MSALAHNPLRRIAAGLGANGFMLGTQVMVRLLEVPLLLAAWGATVYGEWLMLSALVAFVTLLDGGFAKTARREMMMRAGRGDTAGVYRLFQTGWTWLLGLAVVELAIMALVLPLIPLNEWLGIRSISAQEFVIIVLIASFQWMMVFHCELMQGALATANRYAESEVWMAAGVGSGFVFMAIIVLAGGGMLPAAIAALLGTIVTYVGLWQAVVRKTPLRPGWATFQGAEVRTLALPSFANLAFPLSEAVSTQGVRLVVGVIFDARAVAVFSAVRTLCRTALQPVIAVTRTLEPELASAYGGGDMPRARALWMHGSQYALWFAIVLALGLTLIGPYFFEVWTRGELEFTWPLYLLLMATSLVGCLSSITTMVCNATNRHVHVAGPYALGQAAGCLGLTFVLGELWGNPGVGLGLLLTELAVLALMTYMASRIVEQPITGWLRTLVLPPSPAVLLHKLRIIRS